jgi:putative hydrolase of the HAD superfamily
VATSAVLLDLDNTLLLEDESTFAALRRACAHAHARAGVDPDALFAAVLQGAQDLWRAAPIYAYAEQMGIWWGEGLWGDFDGAAPETAELRAFVSGFRGAAWRVALGVVGVADDELAQELADAYRSARRKGQLVDGSAEAVVTDLVRDHRLALVTNGASDVQREKLAATTLAPLFTAIVISAEVGIGKPDRRIFDIALRAIGADAGEAVMVGDSLLRDVAGAQSAGIRVIHLDRGTAEAIAGTPPVPDARIHSLSELRTALAALAPGDASPRGSREPHPA